MGEIGDPFVGVVGVGVVPAVVGCIVGNLRTKVLFIISENVLVKSITCP